MGWLSKFGWLSCLVDWVDNQVKGKRTKVKGKKRVDWAWLTKRHKAHGTRYRDKKIMLLWLSVFCLRPPTSNLTRLILWPFSFSLYPFTFITQSTFFPLINYLTSQLSCLNQLFNLINSINQMSIIYNWHFMVQQIVCRYEEF